MWLINTFTFELVDRRKLRNEYRKQLESEEERDLECDSRKKLTGEAYAILSHRWQDGEISYQDMKQPYDQRVLLPGWAKLSAFCAVARNKGYHYAWVDTCCINKDSMTELSEAINSMFQWYRESDICIAYLHDIHDEPLTDAEWFQRGWTLQELVAAKKIEFYDGNWRSIGYKCDLLNEISQRTGVPTSVLLDAGKIEECSVAQRMSWAAERITERVEDRAWSLLGLFGIRTMSISYGGGEDAFIALQEEIVKKQADHSIFAWTMDSGQSFSGPLAKSPTAFKGCGNVKSRPAIEKFEFDNLGLSIRLPITPFAMNTYLCRLGAYENGSWCSILLMKLPDTNQYVRTRSSEGVSRFTLKEYPPAPERSLSIVRDAPAEIHPIRYGFKLRTVTPPGISKSQVQWLSRDGRDNNEQIALPDGDHGTAGVISISPSNGKSSSKWSRLRWIKLGFDINFVPICLIANSVYRKAPRPVSFDKALECPRDSKLRREIFANDWINEDGGACPGIVAAWPRGFQRLTFENNYDRGCRWEALNLTIAVKLMPELEMSACAVTSGTSGPSKIWVIDIMDTGGPSPELEHCHSELEYWCLYVFGVLAACLMIPICLNEANDRNIERHAGDG